MCVQLVNLCIGDYLAKILGCEAKDTGLPYAEENTAGQQWNTAASQNSSADSKLEGMH